MVTLLDTSVLVNCLAYLLDTIRGGLVNQDLRVTRYPLFLVFETRVASCYNNFTSSYIKFTNCYINFTNFFYNASCKFKARVGDLKYNFNIFFIFRGLFTYLFKLCGRFVLFPGVYFLGFVSALKLDISVQ